MSKDSYQFFWCEIFVYIWTLELKQQKNVGNEANKGNVEAMSDFAWFGTDILMGWE